MQPLRRTIDPYVGQTIILALVSAFSWFVAIWRHSLGLALFVPVIWLLFAPILYFGLRYRIYCGDDAVCQDASGVPRICIEFVEITKVDLEGGDFSGIVLGVGGTDGRPFRRIAIYKHGARGQRNFIDVSLKHFAQEDIRALMRAIHARRPDLTLPKHWT